MLSVSCYGECYGVSPPYHPPDTDVTEAILAAIYPQPSVLEQAVAMQ